MSTQESSNEAVDVVIAGLGPTGLVLSHMLGMRGHRVVVLEREPVFYGNARAVYTDDECMRIFQHLGVAADLQKDMLLETPVYSSFLRHSEAAARKYGVKTVDILVELGRRRMVGGQEDMIVDVALDLANRATSPPRKRGSSPSN